MDKQTLFDLIAQAQKGSRNAMEQLLIIAYPPVYFQCRRLLNDPQMAERMTERILKSLPTQIVKIENADHFHKWLGNVTAARCMKMRQQVDTKEYIPDSRNLSFPGNELSKAETAQVALILADSLPEETRICLVLSVCCRISTKIIAQMTDYAEDTVRKHIADAQLAIREQMLVYQGQGVIFSGDLSVAALLRRAMYGKQNPSAAAAMAAKVLSPVAPAAAPVQPPQHPNHTIKILLCVAVALVLLLILLICGVLMKNHLHETEETMQPPSTAATAETETTEMTTAPTTEATTEPTTQPTTEATTVPETTEAVEITEAAEVQETTAPKTSYTPSTNTAITTGNSSSKPTVDPDYNPGQGEDGHTHDYFSVPAGQNATCTRAAKIHRLCRICKKGITIDDPDNPALGHSYKVNIVVPPTTSSQGYTVYTCTRCGDNYDSDFVDPLPAPTQPPASETLAPVVETQAPEAQGVSSVPDPVA